MIERTCHVYSSVAFSFGHYVRIVGRCRFCARYTKCDVLHESQPSAVTCAARQFAGWRGAVRTFICRAIRGQESQMTFPHVSAPPMRSPLQVGVLRTGVLALVALIVGSMFTYDLIRSSPRTPLPTPRPSALGADRSNNDGRRHRRNAGSGDSIDDTVKGQGLSIRLVPAMRLSTSA